jgi:hypothetical protein
VFDRAAVTRAAGETFLSSMSEARVFIASALCAFASSTISRISLRPSAFESRPERRMPAKQRLLHHDEVGGDQVLDDPLRNCSHVFIGLIRALAAAIAQSEGDRLGEVQWLGG